ncbi:MAG: ThiF family adenylyltransferase [Planctomycetota bacterium]|nr:ThiF family adenylyltransferase [Planctomycetota bacterium]MDA1105928.1 ThiF family adenylyltransferase [Planctomycetota bacterium]
MTGTPTDRFARVRALHGLPDGAVERWQGASVLVAGVGALGCVAAELLARAGVGHLVLVDRDIVEWTNLPRQLLYSEDDARQSRPKASAARARLLDINSSIRIEAFDDQLDGESIHSYAHGVHAVVDGLDNIEARQVVNEWCVDHRVPYFHAAAVGWEGRSLACLPGEGGACFRCAFPELPAPGTLETCESAGIFTPAAVRAANAATAECLKCLAGMEAAVDRRLHSFNALTGEACAIGPIKRDPDCPCCGRGERPFLRAGAGSRVLALCGRGAMQVLPARGAPPVELGPLLARLSREGDFAMAEGNRLVGTIDSGAAGRPLGLEVHRDGRVIVRGTADERQARLAVSRYIGT